MKKGLLGSTAIVAATALTVGAAQAAEAPTWKLSGFMNFQVYVPSGDLTGFNETGVNLVTTAGTVFFTTDIFPTTTPTPDLPQDGSMYFGVDDAELTLTVSGTADNGLEYGFKIEFEGSPGGSNVADEARIQLGGTWGTLQLGDEDGVEDTMNFGGESLLGATGAWDGDGDDVMGSFADYFFPTIIGDTSDNTKVTYYSPRFSGIQVGASYTPSANNGNDLKLDTAFENNIALGANYDSSFGDVSIKASAVYVMASSNNPAREDIGAYSIGGIVGFGPVEVGANWTDNGDSAAPKIAGVSFDDSYWNVAVGFTSGPLYLSGGYMAHTISVGPIDLEGTAWGLTADYEVADGLGVYAEYTSYNAEITGVPTDVQEGIFIAGVNVSF